MIRIETEVENMIVEIDEKEYPVAPRTVGVCDRIERIEKESVGKPVYKMWLATLEVLLGADACRELFVAGKNENVDRIHRIYRGVCNAFEYNANETEAEEQRATAEAVATALAPVNELFKRLDALEKREAANVPAIRKP